MTAVGLPAAQAARTSRGRLLDTVIVAGLAILAYVPFLASSPHLLSADTKEYLYLDPSRLLARAPYLWDPHVGMGTVPHQQIGYLFPMGPYYWLMDRVGMPDWIAQRLWLGTISFAAVLGARWLFTMLGTGRAGALAGAIVYMLTPYQLAFTARISVILLAWAGLPWLVGLTIRSVRDRGWHDPALFALVLLTIGSVNASSVLLVAIAPALWLVIEALGGRAAFRNALQATGRIALLSFGVSLWWIVGLRTQGTYGLPVLQLTETLRTVSATLRSGRPAARDRELVLLRLRPARLLHRSGRVLRRPARRDRRELRGSRRRAVRRRRRAVASSGILRGARRGGHDRRGRARGRTTIRVRTAACSSGSPTTPPPDWRCGTRRVSSR